MVPTESRSDNWGTAAMFDIRIINLNLIFYMRMMPKKALAKVEKYKKDKYRKACLERRETFTPVVYSADRIPGLEALAAKMRLTMLLRFKLRRGYYKLCGFVETRMYLKK